MPALLGAVLLWDFLTRVMQGVTMAFFEDVWSRNFLNFFATPLRMSEYLAGLLVVAVSTSLVAWWSCWSWRDRVRPVVPRLRGWRWRRS